MAKGNKEMLESINYSLNLIKRIQAGDTFTKNEKEEILNKYVGMSEDNNSYFTPILVCDWFRQLLDIKYGRIADLSAGIGNMVRPFVAEYGKLLEGIEFDCFEYDANNSLAGQMAWSDYGQVKYIGDFDTIKRHNEVPGEFDYVIGNPPFSGSVEYIANWNVDAKGKAKTKNDICNAFVDLAIRKTKDKGYIALVLPMGHMCKSQATAKLREWMRSQVALLGVIPLDSGTFAEAGVQGTSVGTVLCVWQKGVKQSEVFIGELSDQNDIAAEMQAMAYQFRLFVSGEYDIEYTSDCYRGTYGKLKQRVKPWTGSVIA